ncbi:class I SAM-dependent methyltransferase [Cerasicoccus fimbriatus]|uniref:class I SAM-dependent methyltransferase n=1 Tax=Cerasicoccus fimbriatus TaxID=3014554 RepID=UPI0022B2D7B2|nr:class I SAM-dependent methyltransferase [Cerasicoccus sp. TK19100]
MRKLYTVRGLRIGRKLMADTPIEMNSLAGKKALSLVREADYAHAGDSEAIDMVFKKLPRDPSAKVLDVGSGLGATADYIRQQGWGEVTGIDRSHPSVIYANEHYKRCNFIHTDVVDSSLVLKERFDLLVSFNAFYAFDDQAAALQTLSHVASHESKFAIFDYVDRGGYASNPIMENGKPFLPNPLRLDKIERLLAENGWRLFTIEPLHPHFADWYGKLVERTKDAEEAIKESTPEGFYEHMLSLYTQLHDAIADNRLGGAIVRAVHGKAQL